MTDQVTGKCMCGAVEFAARNVPDTFGVCHCEMCRRWTGVALLEVSISNEDINWTGEAHVSTYKSSPWAERAWCNKCGSGLYYKVTHEGDYFGSVDVPIGLFDNPNGFHMSHETYVDHKPDSFALVDQNQKRLTRQQCVEKFPLLGGE